jgi:uncharacterized protein YprB with RNaseH-like and TPR domain/predicted nuclease with RNAse H fold/dephospho-CoA kinase
MAKQNGQQRRSGSRQTATTPAQAVKARKAHAKTKAPPKPRPDKLRPAKLQPMLESSFLHIEGVGAKRERQFWDAGFQTWKLLQEALSETGPALPLSASLRYRLLDGLRQSQDAVARRDVEFFANRLPRNEHYRMLQSFPEKVAFLDIESTGLSQFYDQITLIGVSVGKSYSCFIAEDDPATLAAVADTLNSADIVVTYNGSLFDLPFLKAKLSELALPKFHVDLRFFAKASGLTGGQKAVEQSIGVERTAALAEIEGEKAPLLWHNYRLGSVKDLETLIKYNAADINGLKFILDSVLAKRWETLPFGKAPPPPLFSEQLVEAKFAKTRKSARKGKIFLPPYGGRIGPRISYDDLIMARGINDISVVGIDLTGSEKRGSGWALMSGARAYTNTLATDEDLIAHTLRHAPDLVSIDSPLSIPKGRISVTDDDPGRDEFGIMRVCERILKKRGINVYPCLLPSMQKLTARGMRLAGKFRELGIPVIESYPGAAQDIMGIPRKQAGLDYLAKATRDFGVQIDADDRTINHDEWDAVTAAIVGVFFWSGSYEPLGDEDEDYLIVPELETQPDQTRLVVGLSGPISAGKTTAAQILTELGYTSTRFSLVLRNMLEAKGQKPTREALQALGAEVNASPGQRWLCKKAIELAGPSKRIVVDGMRFAEDRATLVETFGPAFVHIHIAAPSETRKQRYISAGGSETEFHAASTHPVESGIWELERLSDEIVTNNRSVEEFRAQLESAIVRASLRKRREPRCR